MLTLIVVGGVCGVIGFGLGYGLQHLSRFFAFYDAVKSGDLQ